MQFLIPQFKFTARSFEELQRQLEKMYDDIYREILTHTHGGEDGGVVSDQDISYSTLVYTEVSSFSNSWVNYGGGAPNAAYVKEVDGWVHLIGWIKDGSVGSAAFTLPEGYRPATVLTFSVVSNSGAVVGRVNINTAGTVVPMSPCNNTQVALDQISFYVG